MDCAELFEQFGKIIAVVVFKRLETIQNNRGRFRVAAGCQAYVFHRNRLEHRYVQNLVSHFHVKLFTKLPRNSISECRSGFGAALRITGLARFELGVARRFLIADRVFLLVPLNPRPASKMLLEMSSNRLPLTASRRRTLLARSLDD